MIRNLCTPSSLVNPLVPQSRQACSQPAPLLPCPPQSSLACCRRACGDKDLPTFLSHFSLVELRLGFGHIWASICYAEHGARERKMKQQQPRRKISPAEVRQAVSTMETPWQLQPWSLLLLAELVTNRSTLKLYSCFLLFFSLGIRTKIQH